jgi:hypothetical protein
MPIEKPEYEVLHKENNFELRQYDPFITAEVKVIAKNSFDAINQGFNILASFIFGNNISRKKISMTAPVTSSSSSEKIAMTAPVMVSGSDIYTVSFTMPRKYSVDSLPQPSDPRVTIHQQTDYRMAAVRFSGFFNNTNFSRHEKMLVDWLNKQGLKPTGSPVIAGYNPPFTPWFLKHNEVLIAYSK